MPLLQGIKNIFKRWLRKLLFLNFFSVKSFILCPFSIWGEHFFGQNWALEHCICMFVSVCVMIRYVFALHVCVYTYLLPDGFNLCINFALQWFFVVFLFNFQKYFRKNIGELFLIFFSLKILCNDGSSVVFNIPSLLSICYSLAYTSLRYLLL